MSKNAIVLGNFDGVHKAHAALIQTVCKRAGELGLNTVAYIFDRHPKTLLGGFAGNITTNWRKQALIKQLGIQTVHYEALTSELLATDPEDFVKNTLVKQFNAGAVGVGYDYRFGREGKGTPDILTALGGKYGFEVYVMPPMMKNGIPISSTTIREALRSGDIKLVNELSHAPYEISGRVTRGKRLGTKRGIPTVNVHFEDNMLLPKSGVYLSRTFIGDKEYGSITNIGVNPTVENTAPHTESHIIGYSGDLYGAVVRTWLLGFLREEKRFNSIEALYSQITQDIETAKRIFG